METPAPRQSEVPPKRDHNLDRNPVWYLPGPFYQYNEDVKALAKRHRLRIIDATVTEDRSYAADPTSIPQVTLKNPPAPIVLDDDALVTPPQASRARGKGV